MKSVVLIQMSRGGAAELLKKCGGELRANPVRGDHVRVDGESECYRAWKAKHAPATPKPRAARPATGNCSSANDEGAGGPGTFVRSMLAKMGFEQMPDGGVRCGANGATISSCGCRAFERRMNRWGWGGCILHGPEIVRWFASKARLCGAKLDAATIAAALAAARHEAVGK